MSSTALPPDHPAYPQALMELDRSGRPSPTLYVRGRLPATPGVAVVGTRHPSEPALGFTRTLVEALVAEGLSIWSGGAVGIDAAAHEAALAAGGLTVVVAGGGLDRPYPRQHCALFDRVLEQGGALLSRVPDETPPMVPGFLQRNEVLAALTQATVVIQAGLVSGARSTAAAARRLGRILCVVPHAPWDEQGRGCAAELVQGAIPVSSAADVLVALGRPSPEPRLPKRRRRPKIDTHHDLRGLALPFERRPDPAAPGHAPLQPAPFPPPDGLEAAILAALDDVPRHMDEVCERVGLPARGVGGALLTLTLGAVVVEGPAGFFRRLLPPRS